MPTPIVTTASAVDPLMIRSASHRSRSAEDQATASLSIRSVAAASASAPPSPCSSAIESIMDDAPRRADRRKRPLGGLAGGIPPRLLTRHGVLE